MNLNSYLAESEKRYPFRIKTVVPLGDKEMDRIDLALARYRPLEITAPAKTILQKHPMDFKDLENAEVWIVDIVLGLPASPYVLQQDIRQNLNIPEKYIVVRGDGEPIELQGQMQVASDEIEDEARERGLRPASLLANPDYPEASKTPDASLLFGQTQIGGLLDYLAKVRDERAELRTDPPHPIFNWLDMPDRKDQQPVQDGADFNANVKDAPTVRGKPAGRALNISTQGNLDDENREVIRLKMDQKGKTVVVKSKLKGIRKEAKPS